MVFLFDLRAREATGAFTNVMAEDPTHHGSAEKYGEWTEKRSFDIIPA
jgi:hypothetical protein